jgi:hypothetical protein
VKRDIMNIFTVVFITLSASFAIAYLSALHKIKKLTSALAQSILTNSILEHQGSLNKTEEEIHKENFIKFLSDSREWAYSYIEQVQDTIKNFIKEVEPEIRYHNNYGVVIEGLVPPNDKALKKISKEFEELKKLLPEDTNDRR